MMAEIEDFNNFEAPRFIIQDGFENENNLTTM